jgi:hypothetical protein
MPAPVALSPTAHTSNKATGSKPRAPLSKKTRVVRRRGRAKDTLESDDEIEREVGTDSDTDDDQSSVDSASDSDTEPASEDVLPNGHARVLTPNLTQSSAEMVSVAQAHSEPKVSVNGDQGSFFAGAPGNWSEMVTDENVNGPADLPVIDFADFDGHPDPRRPRKAQRGAKKPSIARKTSAPVSVPSAPASLHDDEADASDSEGPIASTSHQPFLRRTPGQTARQAYQQRLDKDPSYVPTVGEFWGHDDRLLDKDLRSLSGWWRGRWQGRGRGRGGFDRGFARGRGRGGPFGYQVPLRPSNQDTQVGGQGTDAVDTAPPIEKAWTHDGFEEMKQREDNHRPVQQPSAQPVRGMGGFRGGRGAFTPGSRGRGGIARGGFTPSPIRPYTALPFVPPAGRTWFAMKPERVWTKQHDGFLHVDPALKPRPGQGQGISVKLPGTAGQVIRVPPGSLDTSKPSVARASTSGAIGFEDGERLFVVRIPKKVGKEKQPEQASTMESFTTVEEPPVDDGFTVRQRPAIRPSIPDSQTTAAASSVNQLTSHFEPAQAAESSKLFRAASPPHFTTSLPESTASLSVHADAQGWIQPNPAPLQSSDQHADHMEISPMVDGHLPPPVLPLAQTSYTPVPQVSPRYGSPYGYSPGLPPGVAMNQQGVPYEVSTGRAIYYQAPQQVYNPRPVMHTHMAPPGIPFVPGHMRHPATASPDFLAPPHTPPVNGFIDPSTGTPIFSMPRQSSRIEIRAPAEQAVSPKTVRRPSALRTTATAFEPQRSMSDNQDQSYFPNIMTPQTNESYAPHDNSSGGHPNIDAARSQTMDAGVMSYPPYQQQYYYPPEHYSYSQYVDMSQVTQYDMYPSDPNAASQPAAYY